MMKFCGYDKAVIGTVEYWEGNLDAMSTHRNELLEEKRQWQRSQKKIQDSE